MDLEENGTCDAGRFIYEPLVGFVSILQRGYNLINSMSLCFHMHYCVQIHFRKSVYTLFVSTKE